MTVALPVIQVDGEQAKGHWLMYIFISEAGTGNAKRWISGRYDCEYMKMDGRWKFKTLIYTAPWPH